jgi:tetratricopeptide (TPR) repeat protein
LAGGGDPVACRDLAVLLGFDPGHWVGKVLNGAAGDLAHDSGWFNLGLYLRNEGRFDQAVKAFEMADSLGEPDAALEAAFLYASVRDYSKAAEWAGRSPDKVHGPAWRADYLGYLGNEAAKRALLEAAKDTSWDAAVDWVRERYKPFDPHQAIKLLEGHGPWHNPALLVALAKLYRQVGDGDSALAALQRAVKLGELRAMYRLGLLWCDLGYRKKGLRLMRHAARGGHRKAIRYLNRDARLQKRRARARKSKTEQLKKETKSLHKRLVEQRLTAANPNDGEQQ